MTGRDEGLLPDGSTIVPLRYAPRWWQEPTDWDKSLKTVSVDVTVRGDLSDKDRKVVESGAHRSPVHYMFSKTGLLKTKFHYQK
jgi:hypothetical protein